LKHINENGINNDKEKHLFSQIKEYQTTLIKERANLNN
jgi:hypothetical protein